MSKGSDSKNIEEQQAAAADKRVAAAGAATAQRSDAELRRKVQALEMQRERVLSERTSSPHRRGALAAALATIERDLEQLGWSIKI